MTKDFYHNNVRQDLVKKYQDIIIDFLHFYQEETGGNKPEAPVQHRIMIDRERNSFQLLSVGGMAIGTFLARYFILIL